MRVPVPMRMHFPFHSATLPCSVKHPLGRLVWECSGRPRQNAVLTGIDRGSWWLMLFPTKKIARASCARRFPKTRATWGTGLSWLSSNGRSTPYHARSERPSERSARPFFLFFLGFAVCEAPAAQVALMWRALPMRRRSTHACVRSRSATHAGARGVLPSAGAHTATLHTIDSGGSSHRILRGTYTRGGGPARVSGGGFLLYCSPSPSFAVWSVPCITSLRWGFFFMLSCCTGKQQCSAEQRAIEKRDVPSPRSTSGLF